MKSSTGKSMPSRCWYFVGYEEFRDEPDIEIIASDSGGAGGLVTWYPVWDVEVGVI